MDSKNLATKIKQRAYELGYDLCGIIKADPFPEYTASLDEHIQRYPEFRPLYEELQEQAYPQRRAEWAKSIIVCIRRYGKYEIPAEMSRYIGKYYIFEHRLTYSREYSDTQMFESFLKDLDLRICRSEITARWAAVRAGLGNFGRNNFIYTQFGSWVWIKTWIADKEMDYDEPSGQGIKCPPNCRRCVDSCPTKALSEPLMMNRGRCVAQLSYYSTQPVPVDLRAKMGTWLYGCDVCQDVCPLNQNKWDGGDAFPKLAELAEYLTLEKIVTMNEATFLRIIQPRFWYIPENGLWIWKSNALRAMANSNESKYHPYIMKARTDAHEKIREMAVWASNQFGL